MSQLSVTRQRVTNSVRHHTLRYKQYTCKKQFQESHLEEERELQAAVVAQVVVGLQV